MYKVYTNLIKFCLVIFALSILVGSISAASVVSIEPIDIEVIKGDIFTANITVDPADSEMMGIQYTLYYDITLLNAINQTAGALLSQDGISTTTYKNKINNTLGTIKYSEARTGVDYGVSDFGISSTITFKAIGSGTCQLNFEDVRISDPNAEYVESIVVNNGTCNIKAIDHIQTPPLPEITKPSKRRAQTPSESSTDNITSDIKQTPSANEETKTIQPTQVNTDQTSEINNRLPGFEISFALAILFIILLFKRSFD